MSEGRQIGRGVRIGVGAAAVAGLLGVGAYVITSHVMGEKPAALEPPTPVPAASSSAPVADSPPASESPTVATTTSSGPSSTVSLSPEDRKRVDDVRADGAKHSRAVQHPLVATGGDVAAAEAATTRMEKTADGTVRVTTAHGDLTGQRDLLIAADSGTPAGDAWCTQQFRFANQAKARRIPNMMICWRVSADRSVVTTGVTKSGTAQPSTYTKIIDREWAKLG